MGRLIVGSAFVSIESQDSRSAHCHLDPSWYFPEARNEYVNGVRCWSYEVALGFPFVSHIHCDDWKDDMKVVIRRLVERRMLGDVFYSWRDMYYDYVGSYTSDGKKNFYKSKVQHSYHIFRFEEADDQVLFNFQFAGSISELKSRHPARADITEEQILQAQNYSVYY